MSFCSVDFLVAQLSHVSATDLLHKGFFVCLFFTVFCVKCRECCSHTNLENFITRFLLPISMFQHRSMESILDIKACSYRVQCFLFQGSQCGKSFLLHAKQPKDLKIFLLRHLALYFFCIISSF